MIMMRNVTDMTSGKQEFDPLDSQAYKRFEASNSILDHCLELVLRTEDPQQSIHLLAEYLGTAMGARRFVVFESFSPQYVRNSYEWCREDVASQLHLLQKISTQNLGSWREQFLKNETVYIEDLEMMRLSDPLIYSELKSQNIKSILVGRIVKNDRVQGFLGFDTPDPRLVPVMEPIISQVGRIVGTQLMRRDIQKQLEEMDLRDPETGLYNKQALYRHSVLDQSAQTMGVIYCQLEANQPVSREAKAACSAKLMELLETSLIYRISPDEIVAVYPNSTQERIDFLRKKFKVSEPNQKWHTRVGSAWSDQTPVVDTILHEAKRWSYMVRGSNQEEIEALKPLFRYIGKNHFDLNFFMESLTEENESGYFFFGDIVNNTYFLSDNLVRKFALNGNILRDLPGFWQSRIKGQKAQQRYCQELDRLMNERQERMDIYHQVNTSEGRMEWVRCYIRIKWNPQKTAPVFCAGRMMMQDVSMLVDTATNFNWETVLCRNLSKAREAGLRQRIIGFSMNDLSKVNNMQGRAFGDNLIRSVSETLSTQLGDRLYFYKLSGMRCAAVLRQDCREDFEQLIRDMRQTIEEKYHIFGIEVPNPCSFTVLDFPRDNVGTLDFVEDLNSCIKLSQQEIASAYLDARNLDIRRIQESANMALELGRDVLNEMENFRIVIQPVVDARTGRIVAGESLLRWKRSGKNVSPGMFIPVLEHENMINRVGRWVLEQSVRCCRRMISFLPEFHLSVNVSLQQLDDEGFLEFIADTLKKYNLDGSHIFLEMTESCMDTEQEKLMHFVNFCATLGIKVALDDFGTGYSSIRVLMQYPTAIIKLDRSLLLEMGKSADKLNFISSIVFACHQFGKQVCIEGVETEEQCEMVKKANCDLIQGFYYYRPMEVDEVYRILSQYDKAPEPAVN